MTAEELWLDFCAHTDPAPGAYSAWAFGDAPDKLAALVYQGVKTATASAFDLYAIEGEPLPAAGEYSVILDARDQAVCIVRTTRVTVVPYLSVTCDHAFKEGEGDRSVAYWRQVHEPFLTRELATVGLHFDPSCRVVCEEFDLVWRDNAYVFSREST